MKTVFKSTFALTDSIIKIWLFAFCIFFSGQIRGQNCACTDFPGFKCITNTGSSTLTTLIASGDLLNFGPAATTPQFIVVFGDINFLHANPATYTFAPGSQIIMRPNTTLSIRKNVLFDGTTIIGCDPANPWGGVVTFNSGFTHMRGSRIIGACTGLQLQSGAQVEVQGSRFSDNSIGIQALGSVVLNGIGIADNIFEVVNPIPNCFSLIAIRGIALSNVPFVQIGNTGTVNPNVFSTPVGIDAVNSNFDVENSKFENRPTGTAIRMTGSGATFTAGLTGLGLTPGNEFITDYGLGIDGQNYNMTLEDALITRVVTGVDYFNSTLPTTLKIKKNWFSTFSSNGISLLSSSFSHVNVTENRFIDDFQDFNNTIRTGVRWQGSSMSGTAKALIDDNVFKDEFKIISGITFEFTGVHIANSTSKIDVLRNQFNQNYPAATTEHIFKGVNALSSSRINLEDNVVAGANIAAAADDLWGFFFFKSGKNTFICNQTKNLRTGFEFFGPLCDQTDYQHSRMENDLTGLLLGSSNTIIGKQIKKENRWVGPSAGMFEAQFNTMNPFFLSASEFKVNDPNPASDYWANPRVPLTGWFQPDASPPIFEECAKVGPDPGGEDPKSRAQKAAVDGEFPDYRGYEASGWEMDLMAFGVLAGHPELLEEGTPDLNFYQAHDNGNLDKLWQAYSDWNGLQQTSPELASALEANREALEVAIAALKEVYAADTDDSGLSDETLETIAGIEAEIAALEETNATLHSEYQTETNERLDQLQSDLDAIEPDNVWETNLKTVLGLRAEKLSSEGAEWSDEQRETLQQIADQCRYEGGIGVVLARAELDNATNYNDEEMCPDLTEERAARASAYTAIVTPNPARDYCQVLLPNVQDARIEVRDLQGRTFRSRNVSGSLVVHFDISDLASGMYLIEVQTATGKETHKIFVNR